MSAVPKKKLCWNCEGNVSKTIDNCPYCGVYLHAAEEENGHFWESSHQDDEDEDSSDPTHSLYPSKFAKKNEKIKKIRVEETIKADSNDSPTPSPWPQIKDGFFPLLLLMTGSIFFLFGTVLFLFSDHGTLILQWNADNWVYFLSASIPFCYMGWRHLQKID